MKAHSPGPNGLPGGYPVTVSSRGVKVDLPEEISLVEAVELNELAQTYDGVQKIEADGRVQFTSHAAATIKDVLGFDCDSFVPQESEELADEQILRFKALERRRQR